MKKQTKMNPGQPVLVIILTLFTLICVLPLVLVLVVSFSSKSSLSTVGWTLFPKAWSLDGWRYVFQFSDQVVSSYKITIFETVVGTLLNLLLNAMFGYALSRRYWALRGFLSIFLLITMLFNGGQVAGYIVNTSLYHLKNNLLILVLPGACGAYTCIVMRTYIQGNVPESLLEAARIDGASEIFTFFRIVLPIMVPVLAAMGFMTAVGHWNQWGTSLLYITDAKKATLQLMLIKIEQSIDFLKNNQDHLSIAELEELKNAPDESMRMAILLVTLGPILVAYPFFQKYFSQGLTIGAVKG
mgnify:FL=1